MCDYGFLCCLNRWLGVITILVLNIYPQFFKGTEGPNLYGDEKF